MDDKAEAEPNTAGAKYCHQLTLCGTNIMYSLGFTERFFFPLAYRLFKEPATLITLTSKPLQLKLCEVRQKWLEVRFLGPI